MTRTCVESEKAVNVATHEPIFTGAMTNGTLVPIAVPAVNVAIAVDPSPHVSLSEKLPFPPGCAIVTICGDALGPGNAYD